MKPELLEGLRGFFRLSDLLFVDDDMEVFAELSAILRWTVASPSNPDRDALLPIGEELASLRMGIILWLASLDQDFFRLARRMTARSLVRTYPPTPLACRMAAGLLDQGEGPRNRRPATARDVLIILALSSARLGGMHITESASKEGGGESACALLAPIVARTYSAVEKVWKPEKRSSKLEDAGFAAKDVSDFFHQICPMN